MARMLYLQCDHGVSGDLLVGALLDCGASEDGLREALAGLNVDGYQIRVSRKLVDAMDGCDFDVVVDEEHENHDHDMAWLFGDVEEDHAQDHDHGHDRYHEHEHGHEGGHHHGHHHGHRHGHKHEHHHGHEHVHAHEHHHHGHAHHHAHRQLSDIRAIIESSSLAPKVQETALHIFQIVAEAEAKAHGATVDTVHFHEVGAVDSIVDVVAIAWCLDDLGIDRVAISPLAEGTGHVRSAHGVLAIPVPAVANIVEANGLVLRQVHRHAELVTPTGAAAVAAIRTDENLPETYRIVATGMGTGKRAYDPISTLRAMIVEEVTEPQETRDLIWKLETEVDDCTGEALGFVLHRLFEAGARDAHFIPVFMKKGRPAYQLEVLCDEASIPALESIIFENTTSIGIRRCPMERTILPRAMDEIQTLYGAVGIKRVVLPNGVERAYPEHADIEALARKHDVSYQEVMRAALAAM